MPRFSRTFSSKWESCGPIYFLRWGGRRAASPSVGVCQLLKMVVNEFRKTLACVAWRFFREHYSFIGSTTERLAAKTRANEGQSRRGFSVLASLQTFFGFRSSPIHFSSAGRLPLPSPPAFIYHISPSYIWNSQRRTQIHSKSLKKPLLRQKDNFTPQAR